MLARKIVGSEKDWEQAGPVVLNLQKGTRKEKIVPIRIDATIAPTNAFLLRKHNNIKKPVNVNCKYNRLLMWQFHLYETSEN